MTFTATFVVHAHCAVTVVIFRHFNRSFYLLTLLTYLLFAFYIYTVQ